MIEWAKHVLMRALKVTWSLTFLAAAIHEIGHDVSLVGLYLVAASAPLWVTTDR